MLGRRRLSLVVSCRVRSPTHLVRIRAGTVTGLAQIGNTLYAVSDLGEFYSVNIGDGDSSFGADVFVGTGAVRYRGTSPLTVVNDGGTPVVFTGLTRGPRNLEGGSMPTCCLPPQPMARSTRSTYRRESAAGLPRLRLQSA